MIPTRANSELTRSIGRCLVTRAESSFSRCSDAKVASAARDGALSADEIKDTSVGVKTLENRRWRADMICSVYEKHGWSKFEM